MQLTKQTQSLELIRYLTTKIEKTNVCDKSISHISRDDRSSNSTHFKTAHKHATYKIQTMPTNHF